MTAPANEATSYLHASIHVNAAGIMLGHSWMSDTGPHAVVNLSPDSYITLNSAAAADALVAAATAARDALAALAASAPPATPEERADFEAWRAARALDVAAGADPLAIPANRIGGES